MRPLTARQQEVLELLKRHLETTGMRQLVQKFLVN